MRDYSKDNQFRAGTPSKGNVITIFLQADGWGEAVEVLTLNNRNILDIINENSDRLFPMLSFSDTVILLRTGEPLDLRLSLAENGVFDRDVLAVRERIEIPHAILYGCPSARDKDGLVPECMLAGFRGSEEALL